MQRALNQPAIPNEDFLQLLKVANQDNGLPIEEFVKSYREYGGLDQDLEQLGFGSLKSAISSTIQFLIELDQEECRRVENFLEYTDETSMIAKFFSLLFQYSKDSKLEVVLDSVLDLFSPKSMFTRPNWWHKTTTEWKKSVGDFVLALRTEIRLIHPKNSDKRRMQQTVQRSIDMHDSCQVVGLRQVCFYTRQLVVTGKFKGIVFKDYS